MVYKLLKLELAFICEEWLFILAMQFLVTFKEYYYKAPGLF